MADEQVEKVYQFKVTLKGSKPPIWRRILVPEQSTLIDLNNAIQAVFDWGHCHLWQFGDFGSKINKKQKITDVFDAVNRKAVYIYDFDDNWDHEVKFETIRSADPNMSYPKCTAGRQAAPPCCCGGIDSFYEMLEIIKDPSHPEYEEKWEWLRLFGADDCVQPGYKFDPDSVDFDMSMYEMFGGLRDNYDSDSEDSDL